MRTRLVLAALFAAQLVTACSCSPAPVAHTYTVGGTVTGLAGSGLVLQNEGAKNLSITEDGPFTWPGTFSSGTAYFVTLLTQPTSPSQTCTIAAAQGTVQSANVTNIAVTCTTSTFTVGGSVTGLSGSGLVLEDNAGDDLTVSANGAFKFATPVANGAAYAVTVKSQPAMPAQTCTVASGTGAVGNAPVTSVLVTCATDTFAIGGSISGLSGTGLVLQDNGGDNLTVTEGSTFTFATPVASGATYSVTVLTQPSNPVQTCTVSTGSGTVVAANVTSVVVTCSSNAYTVGGVVLGLAGTGLVLQDNGDDLSITASGLFTFATPVASSAPFAVTILTQPSNPAQTCVVSGGMGTVMSSAVNTVTVSCATNQYTISGTTTGLLGSGLQLSLNGTTSLAVHSDGAFSFPGALSAGTPYAVAITAQPSNPTQTCTVSGGAGTVGAANVTSVVVSCGTNMFTVGGAITGLSGSGLVLQDNGGDNLSVTANGLFSFATPLASGTLYSVTVLSQPSNPTQTCTVSAASGTVVMSNISGVVVTCSSNKYALSGTITGLTGTGLVLEDNVGDDVTLMPGATSFAFATSLASGAAYAVTVVTEPSSPAQTCIIANGSGTIGSTAIADVAVTCTTNTYAVGGTVIGLQGSGLVLQDNGGDNLSISTNGTFTFATHIASDGMFDVTVLTQPSAPAQTCVVTGATGAIVNAGVSSVTVNCGSNGYTVSGTVTGLAGSGLVLSLNGSSDVSVQSNGAFSFPQALTDGVAYMVGILTQPTNPTQTCMLSGAAGTIMAASVSNVAVSCGTNAYPVTVSVTGLAGSGLVLEDNGSDMLPVPTTGTYTFPMLVASGASYAVTVAQQPANPAQTCIVSSGSGSIGGAAVSSVIIACTTNTYSVGGTIVGLAGTVVLQDNGADTLIATAEQPDAGSSTLSEDGGLADGGAQGGESIAFTFSAPVASGTPYAVTVSQQPGSPSQTCAVSHDPSGTIGAAPITDVVVTCTTNTFNVDVTVVGLAGSGLVLGDNVGDMVPVTSNGVITLQTKQASATTYTVSVLTQPTDPTQTCSVIGGIGTVGASDVTGITVNCGTNQYTVGGTVSGLSGAGLVVADNLGDTVPISGNGSFSFPTTYSSSALYAVSVQTQPQGPWQTCTVANGSGTIGMGNVTNVAVSCTTNSYTVSVSVTGLSGGGLQLVDNAFDTLAVAQDGVDAFAVSIPSDGTYAVTVLNQPTTPWQTCSVAKGTGTIAGANVTVAVSCTTNKYAVNVSVSGLAGSGLQLLDNGGDALPVTGNGTVGFVTQLASGSVYDVTIAKQPTSPTQSCVLSSSTGTIAGAPVTVTVSCSTTSFTIGGTVTGLATSESLQLANGSDTISVTSNGAFTFDVQVASGAAYSVTVSAQPSSPVAQTCTVTGGVGSVVAANVTNIAITCTTNTFSAGGTLSGYAGSGLVLQDNGGNNLTIPASALSFKFASTLASGAAYAVSVLTQPTSPWQTCTVANGTGTVASANVTNVAITCTSNSYAVGGTVAGLAGGTLVLQNGTASNTVSVSVDGTFQFPPEASGSSYAVTVQTQPTSPVEGCTVTNGTGTIGGAPITNIAVSCATDAFTVGGTITGYTGSGLQLLLNGGNATTLTSGASSFTFGTSIPSDQTYAVTVAAQPTVPTQVCTVGSGSGTVTSANITSVTVSCVTSSFTVGGEVSGLAGGSVVLQNSTASNTITVAANGSFQFPAVASGATYAVTVQTQPSSPTQTCSVMNGTGTIGIGPVTNVAVNCTTSTFTVGGSITGYAGSGLQLALNGGNVVTVTSGATSFTFGTPVASGGSYAVTIATQPSSPTQTCTVGSGSGTVTSANIASVTVTCVTSSFTVGGTIAGLAGGSVVLQNNTATNTVTVSSDGTFQFPAVASGGSYAVTVQTQPSAPAQACTVTNGTGTVGSGPVTNIAVACTTRTFTVSGTISGLAGSGLVLQLNGENNLSVAASATTFAFTTPALLSGTPYAVTVATQPSSPTQNCTIANGTGTIGGANVTNVALTCTTNTYSIGVTVTGLASGTLVLQDNGSSNLSFTANTSETFSTLIASGATYSVTVLTQPSASLTCSVTNATGTVANTNVTNVVVSCGCPSSAPTSCSGVCTNTLTSNTNCGSCGAVCASGYACDEGICENNSCVENFLCTTNCQCTAALFSDNLSGGAVNWELGNGGTAPIVTMTDSSACNATFMRETQLVGGGRVFTKNGVAVTSGATYCISAWIRGSSGTCPFLGFLNTPDGAVDYWITGEPCYGSGTASTYVTPVVSDGNWHWYGAEFNSPYSSIRLGIEIWSGCGAGTADYTDFQILQGPCPAPPTQTCTEVVCE